MEDSEQKSCQYRRNRSVLLLEAKAFQALKYSSVFLVQDLVSLLYVSKRLVTRASSFSEANPKSSGVKNFLCWFATSNKRMINKHLSGFNCFFCEISSRCGRKRNVNNSEAYETAFGLILPSIIRN